MSSLWACRAHVAVSCVLLAMLPMMAMSQDLMSCGGFVKPSLSITRNVKGKVDITSAVKIQLVSPQGNIKYEAAPAPNGYYIVPIYETLTGYSLQLQGPPGWTFTPASQPINLLNGQCNEGRDIDFELTGFQVTGNIKSNPKCNSGSIGHSGIDINLLSTTKSSSVQDESIIATATTDENGVFTFEDVSPGSYSIMAGETVVPLQVLGNNQVIRPDIIVKGYPIQGNLVEHVSGGSSSTGVSNIEFVLYSSKSNVLSVEGLPKCNNKSALVGFPTMEELGTPSCVVVSGEDGSITFPSIPCGSYSLIPFSTPGPAVIKQSFDFAPTKLSIKVDAAPVVLKESFELKGFKTVGFVLNARGKGIPDCLVQINGIHGNQAAFSVRTNMDGKYKVEKVVSGEFEISVSKPNSGYLFPSSPLPFSLSPSSSSIPAITLQNIEVCGKVLIPHPPDGAKGGESRKMELDSEVSSSTSPIHLTTTTDATGSYCFQLPASSTPYNVVVRPVVTPSEKAAGLLLSSFESSFPVDTHPVRNINFAQSLLTIRGTVKCLSKPCDPSVSIQLTPVSSTGAVEEAITTGLSLSSVSHDEEARFEFPMLVPGKYVIQMEQNEWCWKEDSFEVLLADSDINNIIFTQTGYRLTIASSHDLKVKSAWIGSNGKVSNEVETWDIKKTALKEGNHLHSKSPNHFCLAKSGTYALTPINSCFQFEQEVYHYNSEDSLNGNGVLELLVKKVLVKGQIKVPAGTSKSIISSLSAHYSQLQQSSSQETALALKPVSADTLEYELWAQEGDIISVHVRSSELLFYPEQGAQVTITPEHFTAPCEATPLLLLSTLEGRRGLFITGKVTPPTSDITITVYQEEDTISVDEASASTDSLSRKLVLEGIKTNKDGSYKAGPLYDDRVYSVEAESSGFHLKKIPSSDDHIVNFQASKLGALKVEVKEGGKGVIGALLSMSGNGYRSNLATDEHGIATFADIFPGDYYLMPLLKEYTFAKDKSPEVVQMHQQPISVTVTDSNKQHLLLAATRVAYSVYGRIVSLNGQPERGVTVQAVSEGEGRFVETAVTDAMGEYRLRGLLPSLSYSIALQSPQHSIERTSPESYTVQVAREDALNKDFLAFRKSSANRFEIFGNLITNSSFLPSLTVQLWEESETIIAVNGEKKVLPASEGAVQELKMMENVNFFNFGGLTRSRYSLRLKVDPSLQRDMMLFKADAATVQVTFGLQNGTQMVDVTLGVESSLEIHESPNSQFFATLLAVLTAIAFYHRKRITKLVNTHILKHKKSVASSGSEASKKSKKSSGAEDRFVADLNRRFAKST